jgi:hypothetical protein
VRLWNDVADSAVLTPGELLKRVQVVVGSGPLIDLPHSGRYAAVLLRQERSEITWASWSAAKPEKASAMAASRPLTACW